MKRLSEKATLELIEEMADAADIGGEHWRQWHTEHVARDAYLELPLGELFNGNIAGYVMAWAMRRAITVMSIDKKDRFAAQGLEGKARVHLKLVTALLAYKELPRFRRAIVLE